MKTKTSRILAVVLIFQLLAFSACAGWLIYDAKVDRSGWAEKDGVRYYRDFHAKPVTGWLDIDGQRYFFLEGGIPATGWLEQDGVTRYFGSDGVMLTGWQTIGGKTYCFGDDGGMLTGWFRVEAQWFYADPSGAVQDLANAFGASVYSYASADGSGIWQRDAIGQWAFAENGSYAVGWRRIDNAWYFFGTDRVMTTGWQFVNGIWYYLNSNGKMAVGWKQVAGKWYYLRSWGGMLSDGTTPDGYRVDASGAWVG